MVAGFFLSCGNGDEAEDPGEEQLAIVLEGYVLFMAAALTECPEIVETGDDDNGSETITFDECEVELTEGECTGTVTISGSQTYTWTTTESTYTEKITGSVTMTGTCAPANTVAFDVTVTVDSGGTTITGTVTIDGVKYNAAGFEDIFDES
jgi:hypothetical protein